MVAQQLEHTRVMTHATASPVTLFKATAKLGEAFRKHPIAIHIRVIQGSRAACECDQIMPRIKDFCTVCVTSHMRSDQFFIVDHFHMIDESLDCHDLERHLSRHAVADIVKANHLVFIDRHRAPHAGFEGVTRQSGRLPNVELQHVADGEFWSGRCVSDCFVVDRDFVCCDVNTGVINSSDFTCDDLASRDLTCGRFAGRRIDARRRRRS